MKCKFCEKEIRKSDVMITCSTCKHDCHPSCLDLPDEIVSAVKTYPWQCNDCKFCFKCERNEHEEKILFCDGCDRGYHMYCMSPPLQRKPKGKWYCPFCSMEKEQVLKNNTEEESSNEKVEEEYSKNRLEDEEMEISSPEDSQPLSRVVSQISKLQSDSSQKSSQSHGSQKKERRSVRCPFPGCDGEGNNKKNRKTNTHYSLKHCPRYREQQRMEKQEGVPPKQLKFNTDSTSLSSSFSQRSEERERIALSPSKTDIGQAPIEHVSRSDREMFVEAKTRAEEIAAMNSEVRPAADEISELQFGKYIMNVWYKSQYPLEFAKKKVLFVCEFCLDYFNAEVQWERHMSKCQMRYPPGNEIYRKNNLSIFEVDGESTTKYCQNLCLLAKLFLDHKTQWDEIQPFLFYVLTESDETGSHMIGYFSKEKNSFLNYNVSCILVMPQHMQKGYGKFLIEFSYLLSRVEEKIGQPERPLSDLGLTSYRSYWGDKILQYLVDYPDDEISIKGVSEKLAIHANDVVSTLQYLGMLKYWKGQHIIVFKEEVMTEFLEKRRQKVSNLCVDPTCLKWKPPTTSTASK